MSPIAEAFAACCDGYAVDRVIVDPELNSRFIAECRARGCTDVEVQLNLQLFNLRKQGKLSQLKAAKRTSVEDQDSYRFASEIAARFMERKHGLSLDMILCDSELAAQFDELAQRIAPGFTSLQYRYAALNLRKVKKLQPELVARVASATKEIHSWSMSD